MHEELEPMATGYITPAFYADKAQTDRVLKEVFLGLSKMGVPVPGELRYEYAVEDAPDEMIQVHMKATFTKR